MRLDFNILWVEDQPDRVDAQRTRIEHLIRKQGFKLQTEFATSLEQAKKFISDDIFGDHIDLVLMDFELGDGPNGDEGLEMIRDCFPYKDIIFYSAKVPQDLMDMVSKEEISGVFCSSRVDLPDTVFGVFNVLVKKVLDIDHSRGIVMGATSEIDGFIKDTLLQALENADDVTIKKALEIITEQLSEIEKRFSKDFGKITQLNAIQEILGFHNIYTSAHRLKLCRKVLELQNIHQHECKAILDYNSKTIPRRNDLAHVTVKRNGFSRKIYDRNGKELTAEDMRVLRADLLKHHELFESLSKSL